MKNLSLENQSVETRKILKSQTDKSWDISFIPAVVNRVKYKNWVEKNSEFISYYKKYQELEKCSNDDEKLEILSKFNELSSQVSELTLDIISFVLKVNGHIITDQEILENFDEQGLVKAIYFIIGVEASTKKK